ncbi:MAG: general secretion pathway protein GspK [Hyphomicrobiales bacterium]|nr:general secretion pathway protein GspK [Hyphomicrobiales bacterium]
MTPRADRSRRGASDEGAILVVVVGVLLLLAIIASTLMIASRNQLRARAALGAHAEATAVADGVVRLVALRMAERRAANAQGPWMALDGTPAFCRDGGFGVEVRITDTAGLVDLNASSLDTFELLLTGIGVPSQEAGRLAAAIVDYRDPDDVPGVGGAESREYRQAGRAVGPKNAPFDSVDELDQVLGLTPDLVARLRPLVTVYSRATSIDPAVAPLALLQAVSRATSGGGGADVASVPREQIRLPPQFVRRTVTRGSRNRLPVFIVRVVAGAPNGVRFLREATIELASASPTGFVVRNWTSYPAGSVVLPAAANIPLACEALQ